MVAIPGQLVVPCKADEPESFMRGRGDGPEMFSFLAEGMVRVT